MKKFIFNALFISNVFGSGFEGCGEYQFKGILRQQDNSLTKLVYIVNEGTKSQLVFDLSQKASSSLIPLLNKNSSFMGRIVRPMDGTKGVIEEATKIANRISNPLIPYDTGIEMKSSLKCKK